MHFVKKSKDSPFHMHSIKKHNGSGRVAHYEMKVTKVYSGDATKRQVSEAIQIQHAQGEVMNKQDEWRQVKLRYPISTYIYNLGTLCVCMFVC